MTTDAPSVYVYSPSQVESWNDCNRKWAWDKIAKIPRGESASARLGTQIHAQLEAYQKGLPFDFAADHHAARLAQEVTPWIPAPNDPCVTVEGEISFPGPKWSKHSWTGRIDWYRFDGQSLTIGDHKSTSSIASYAKTPEALATDTQAIVYSAWGIRRFNVEKVDLQWTYVQTRGALRAEPRRLTLYREHIQDRMALLDQVANEITTTRETLTEAKEYPHNPDACDKYGGCPYRNQCNLSPLEALRFTMSNTPSLMDRLGSLAGNMAPPAPAPAGYPAPPALPGMPAVQAPPALTAPPAFTPPAPTPPAPQAAPTAEDMYSIAVKDPTTGNVCKSLSNRDLPPNVIQTGWVQNPQTGGYLPTRPLTHVVAQLLEHAANEHAENVARGVVQGPAPGERPAPPPPAPSPAPATGWAPPGMQTPPPAPPPAFAPPATTGPINPPEWQPPPGAAPTAPVQAVAPATLPQPPAPAEPKRRGRPKGSKNTPASAPEQTNTPAVTMEGGADISFLYVNCAPSDWDGVFSIDDLIQEASDDIRKDNNGTDWAMIDYKGAGVLALYVENLVATKYKGASLVLDVRTREGQILCSRLAGKAGCVVRGF